MQHHGNSKHETEISVFDLACIMQLTVDAVVYRDTEIILYNTGS